LRPCSAAKQTHQIRDKERKKTDGRGKKGRNGSEKGLKTEKGKNQEMEG
jgi:hypothetical protein